MKVIQNPKNRIKLHYILYIVAIFSIFSLISTNFVSADSVTTNVNIAPSLTLDLSSTSLASSLDPSSHTFDSKDLAVSVATNNKTGYQLTMTTTSTSLINTEDSTLTIPTLDALSGGYTPSTFQTNKWGYSKNNGNYFPFPASELLLQNDVATNGDNTDLTFATKIDYNQPSGTYKTTITFNATANPLVDYMQNFTPDMCRTLASSDNYTVVDKRDDNDYTVRYINGNCWMTQNLRFTGSSLNPATSNVDTEFSIEWEDLTAGDSNAVARYHDSGNTTQGVWYNYAGASAATITGSSNSLEATQSICPAGWRLPSRTELDGMVNYKTEFQPVASGFWSGGSYRNTGSIYIWSSTAASGANRYGISMPYNGGNLSINNVTRVNGDFARCILNDPRTISDITTMQEMSPQIAAKMTNGDTATLKDSRDGQDYTIAKINGNVWMTRNLAIGCDGSGSTYGANYLVKNLTSADTNISADFATPTMSLAESTSYEDAQQVCDSTYGAWYNYVAVTAGTITGSSNNTIATYDICPLGWKVPTSAQIGTLTSYRTQFNPTTGGIYNDKVIRDTTIGYYWTQTPNGTTQRYYLYNKTSMTVNATGMRYNGFYIRCIAK